MARNNHDWFPWDFRAWLESRRVQRMSLAAQGLYVRALSLQGTLGNIPANPEDLAIELKVRHSDMGAWEECLQHFESETIDGDNFLYNRKLRDVLEDAKAKSEKKSKVASDNGSKGGRPPKDKNQQLSQNKAIGFLDGNADVKAEAFTHACNSNSNSLYSFSDDIKNSLQAKFQEFWTVYPRAEGIREAWEAWLQEVDSTDLADQIITHVRSRAVNGRDWLKDDGKWIPSPAKFLKQQLWHDNYKTKAGKPAPAAAEPEPEVSIPVLAPLSPGLWQEVLYHFRLQDPEVLSEWIEPLSPLGIAEGPLPPCVWIVAPSTFAKQWIIANYLDKIASLLGVATRIVSLSEIPSEASAMKET